MLLLSIVLFTAAADPAPRFQSPHGISLVVPDGFAEATAAQNEGMPHVWAKAVKDGSLVVSVQRMPGGANGKCPSELELKKLKLPPDTTVEAIPLDWQGAAVCAMLTTTTQNGAVFVDYMVDLPLPKGAALHVGGPKSAERLVLSTLTKLLKTVRPG